MICTNTKKKEKKKEIMYYIQYIYVKSDNADSLNAVSEMAYSELMKQVTFNVFPLKQRSNEHLQSFCQIVPYH